MSDLNRLSSLERELAATSKRGLDLVMGRLPQSSFERAIEEAQQAIVGPRAFSRVYEQMEMAQRAIGSAGGLDAISKRHRAAMAEIDALGGFGQIHQRAHMAQRAIDAAGGHDLIAKRLEAMAALTSPFGLGVATADLIARQSLGGLAAERAMRDLAGVGSFGSSIATKMSARAEHFEAMISGAGRWRATAGIGLSLAAQMHRDFPGYYPDRRLATVADVARAPLGSLAERVLRDQAGIERIRNEMLGLRSPWVDASDPLRSVRAYTDARALMRVVSGAPAESRRVIRAVRQELGDYRTSESLPADISADPFARTAFRFENGFNPDLSSLPTAVLVVIFSWLGFKATAQASVDPDALQDVIHNRMRRIELRVRRFVEARMSATLGSQWHKHRVDGQRVGAWRRRRQVDIDNLRSPSRLFDYAGFEDYLAIIERGDNWRDVFSKVFPVKSSLLEGLRRLSLIRNPDAHIRILTVEDMIDLAVEGRRIDQWLDRAG